MPETMIVTTYEHPDLDGYACAIAYAEYLNSQGTAARPFIYGIPHDEVVYVLERYKPDIPTNDELADGPVALMDASDILGLPPVFKPEQVHEIIDHRSVNQASFFPHAKAQIEMVGAAATLIAEKFEQDGLTPSPAASLLLYAAIASNTLAFKATVTTERDRRMAEWLNQSLKTDKLFVHDFFKAKSQLDGEKLYGRIASDFARFQFGGESIGIAQIEMIGAQELIDARSEEMIIVIQQLGKEFDLDHSFISLVDIEAGATFLLSHSAKTRDLVGSALGLSFEANPLRYPGLIMRKEISPLLRQQLEPQS